MVVRRDFRKLYLNLIFLLSVLKERCEHCLSNKNKSVSPYKSRQVLRGGPLKNKTILGQ